MATLELAYRNDHLLSRVDNRAMTPDQAMERARSIKGLFRSVARDIGTIGRLASELRANGNWRLLDSSYRSWDDCCRNEFDGAYRQAIDRFADFYETTRCLPEDVAGLITCESQARPLKGMDESQVVELLREVVEDARHDGKGSTPKVTAALIKRSVDRIREKSATAQVRSVRQAVPSKATPLVLVSEPTTVTETAERETAADIETILARLRKVIASRCGKEAKALLKPVLVLLAEVYQESR